MLCYPEFFPYVTRKGVNVWTQMSSSVGLNFISLILRILLNSCSSYISAKTYIIMTILLLLLRVLLSAAPRLNLKCYNVLFYTWEKQADTIYVWKAILLSKNSWVSLTCSAMSWCCEYSLESQMCIRLQLKKTYCCFSNVCWGLNNIIIYICDQLLKIYFFSGNN